MPFGMVSRVSRVMGVLDGGSNRRRGRGTFGGEFWASHCNQWGLCCVVGVIRPKSLVGIMIQQAG